MFVKPVTLNDNVRFKKIVYFSAPSATRTRLAKTQYNISFHKTADQNLA